MSGRIDVARPDGLSLVVPMFDEADRFVESWPHLARYIEQRGGASELVFVDDGSDDATSRVVQEALDARPEVPARLLRIDHAGKGAAIRHGLRHARCALAGFCDVDLSTPLEQLDLVVLVAERAQTLAIGSRDVAASRLLQRESRLREGLGRLFNRVVQLVLAPGISDTQCGAKVAPAALWDAVLPHSEEDGFAWDCEVIALAGRLGFSVQEVAIDWRHDPRSRVRLLRDGSAMLRAIPRVARRVSALPASRSAPAGGIFDEAQAQVLADADSSHWWFRSKAAFVASALRRSRAAEDGVLLDVGAGAGGVTAMLGWRIDRLVATDGSRLLAAAGRTAHGLAGTVARTEALPIRSGSASVVTSLDVLEHLDDPVAALVEAHRALADGGVLVITVPAHEALWSRADVLLGHVRRYSSRALRDHVETAGFEVERLTHVFSWLVLPVWLQRRLVADDRQLGLDRQGRLVDAAALVLTRLERAATRWLALPVGTSIVCVARRVGPPRSAGSSDPARP